jgi:hypothetical protein
MSLELNIPGLACPITLCQDFGCLAEGNGMRFQPDVATHASIGPQERSGADNLRPLCQVYLAMRCTYDDVTSHACGSSRSLEQDTIFQADSRSGNLYSTSMLISRGRSRYTTAVASDAHQVRSANGDHPPGPVATCGITGQLRPTADVHLTTTDDDRSPSIVPVDATDIEVCCSREGHLSQVTSGSQMGLGMLQRWIEGHCTRGSHTGGVELTARRSELASPDRDISTKER